MLLRWLMSIFLNAISLIVVAQLFESFYVETFGTAILASIILSMLNIFVKPILIILTLPITFLTFGFFLFIINAITLMITQSFLAPEFVIDGFGMAIIAAIIIAIINMVLNRFVKNEVR